MKRDLTKGNVFKNIVVFSLPFLLSYFMQTLYGLADLFIIGQFAGVESTTAVSIGSQVMHMVTVMIVGLAMGSTVLIGHAVGAKDEKLTAKAIGNTASLFLAASFIAAVVLLMLCKPIVGVMSTPSEAVSQTVQYLVICFAGIPFITAYNIISSVLRGMGDSKSPMYFIAVACVCNIGLDYLFIGMMGYEARGAALGTCISQAVSVIIALVYIIKKKIISGLHKTDFRPQKDIIGSILRVGIPVSAQDGFIQISFILITVFANRRGLNDAAAVGVVEKLIGILFLVPSSLLSSVSALCAQNLGAGKEERARKTLYYAMGIALIWGLVMATLFQFAASEAVAMFTDEPEVIRLGDQYMRSYVWDCVFAGVHFCFSGYFCACARSEISFLHNIISILTARIPIAYYASVHFADTLYPMGFAAPIGSVISVIVCVVAFNILRKKKERHV